MTQTAIETVTGVPDHPLRGDLINEIHARPAVALHGPACVSHLALFSGEKAAEDDRLHVAALCRRLGATEPPAGANYWRVQRSGIRLNWERHTEFSTYTFFCHGTGDELFQKPVIASIPPDWLAGMPGTVLVAVQLELQAQDAPQRDLSSFMHLFPSRNIAGSRMLGGAAMAWGDFRLHEDGFNRFLILDSGLEVRQAGRLVQRILDMETYRMMALLAFPLAKTFATQVSQADGKLAELTEHMTRIEGLHDQHELLERLSDLAAEIERIAAATNYRFSAARAYYALVQRRISELREERVEGWPTIGEFMDRRLAPAMRTCESVRERLEIQSKRVSRAANLLRTRVDVALESQNRDLLRSMDRRASLQLRLQQTVEGLSVVVLSYYLVGLVGYALKGVKAAGVALNVELLTGLAIPMVVAGVWLGIQRLHRKAGHHPTVESD